MAITFTRNKQVVRDLQCKSIQRHFGSRLGHLKYFGLSSPDMKDVRDWAALFCEFHVVERGREGREHEDQHELLVTAAVHGLSRKMTLLRGEIDAIILVGKDCSGNSVVYPFDVVSLDYSGCILYRDKQNRATRLMAVEELIRQQAAHDRPWLLFLSLRLDAPLDGQLKQALADIRTELRRYGASADEVIDAALAHEQDEVRFKIFVPYFVNQVASKHRLRCQTAKTIIYVGNRGARMMNFQFLLRPEAGALAPRFPQERLVQVINSPFREVRAGRVVETTLGLPKLRVLGPNGLEGRRSEPTERPSPRETDDPIPIGAPE